MSVRRGFNNLVAILMLTLLAGCSGGSNNAVPAGSVSPLKDVGSGKILASDQQLTTDPNDQSQPAVAFDTINHQYMTVWTDSRLGTLPDGNSNKDNSTNVIGRIYLG